MKIASKNITSSESGTPKKSFFKRPAEQSFFSNVQTKLMVGQPGDKYEVEADAMADKVVQRMQRPEVERKTPFFQGFQGNIALQSKCNSCQEEVQTKENDEEAKIPDVIQAKEFTTDIPMQGDATSNGNFISTSPFVPIVSNTSLGLSKKAIGQNEEIQAKEDASEEESIQLKCSACESEIQTKGHSPNGDSGVNNSLEQQLASSKGQGSPLSSETKNGMEKAFGADFSNVNVHTGSKATKMSKQLNAQAFTHGGDIYFNQNKYNPNSTEGQHLLAHELTHTIQQGAAPTHTPSEKPKETNLNKETNANNDVGETHNQGLDRRKQTSNSSQSEPQSSLNETKATSTQDSQTGSAALDVKSNRAGTTSSKAETKQKQTNGSRVNNEASNTGYIRNSKRTGRSRSKPIPTDVSGQNATVSREIVPARSTIQSERSNGQIQNTSDVKGGVQIVQLFQQFRATTMRLRQDVSTSTLRSKNKINQSGQKAVQNVETNLSFVRNNLITRFALAKQQIIQKGLNTETVLQSKANTSNEAYGAQKDTAISGLNMVSETNGTSIANEGLRASEKLIAYGNSAGADIAAVSGTNAERANSLGASYASQNSGDMASEGASAARKHGSDMAISLRSQGDMLNGATTRDAAQMGSELITNSSDAAAQFQDALSQISESFSGIDPIFGSGVNQILNDSLEHTQNLESNSTDQLDTIEITVLDALSELESRFSSLAATGVSKGNLVVDDAATTRLELIDNAELQVFQVLEGVPADPGGEFEEAVLEIQNVLNESLAQADSEVDDAAFRIGNELEEGGRTVNSGTDDLSERTESATDEIENNSVDGFDQISDNSDNFFDQLIEGISESFTEAVECISSKASEAAERLLEDLGLAELEGEQGLDDRNNSAVEAQEERMGSLAEYLRDELSEFLGGGSFARTIASLVLLPVAILEYFVGVIAGLIVALVKFVVGLVLLVVGIIVAFVAFFFLIGVLFAILYECVGLIPAIILTLIAVVVGLLLLAVAVVLAVVVGIVMMVVSIVMNIWKAFTDPTIGPFERGFLIGESIGDIILLLLPFKAKLRIKLPVWLSRRLAPLSARARTLSRLLILCRGNIARLIRLARLFGNDLVKLEEFLILFNDAAFLERSIIALGDVARLERVLPLIDDLAQLGRLINLVRNGARLEALLTHAKIRNAAQLEGLLGSPKISNAGQLESLLNNTKLVDAAQLESILSHNKIRTAAELERLLNNTRITDVAQLEALLNNAKIRNARELADLIDDVKIVDIAQLERLLDMSLHSRQLKRMLDLVTLADDLELYLLEAGGQRNAALLEQLLERAVNMGDYKKVESLLNVAGGNAAKFEQLARAVGRFGLENAAEPAPANLHGYTGININHFLSRHTYRFFDFGDIKANNTFWPRGTNVAAKVDEALTILDLQVPPRRLLPFEQPPVRFALSDGTSIQIGRNNSNVIGQFFALPDEASGVINFVRNEMEAIKVLLIP